MNFTGKRAFDGMSRSPRSTASMWGMPLPGASGAKRTVSQPVAHPTARPKRGSATQPQSGCAWAASRRASRTWSTPSIAQRKSTASPPARTPTAAARAISPGASCRAGASSARMSLGSFVGSTTSEILPDQVIADGQSLPTRPRRDRAAPTRSRNIGISRSRGAGTRLALTAAASTSGRSNGQSGARRRDRGAHVGRDRGGPRSGAHSGREREPRGRSWWSARRPGGLQACPRPGACARRAARSRQAISIAGARTTRSRGHRGVRRRPAEDRARLRAQIAGHPARGVAHPARACSGRGRTARRGFIVPGERIALDRKRGRSVAFGISSIPIRRTVRVSARERCAMATSSPDGQRCSSGQRPSTARS